MECDSCPVDGSFAYTEHLAYSILGAPEEFVNREDSAFKIIAGTLKNFSAHFIASSAFTIDFLAERSDNPAKNLVGARDHFVDFNDNRKLAPDLSLYSNDKKPAVPFHELEFQVLLNNKVIQDWKPATSLPRETEYRFRCGATEETQKECFAFRAGTFTLNVNDDILVKIRKRNTDDVLRNIYIKRPRLVPSIEQVKKFPAGTSVQDILNKQMQQEYSWMGSNDEIETEAGNSVLLAFDNGLNGSRIIEYAFSDQPDQWHVLDDRKRAPSMTPYYLFIENPKPGSTVEVLVRYATQRESVRHIRIIVKPKRTQTAALIIGASLVLAFLLFVIGYYFNKGKSRRQLRQLMLKKEDLENKLQLLSGQLNPHFLFNSLNSIQNLVNKEDSANASAYISQVAVFLRTVMNAGKKEFISLKEELDIAEGYLQLEQKRKPFAYSIINLQSINLSQVDFPPLLLQPVLENSIHHGFSNAITDPAVTIEITAQEKELRIIISDNGTGFDYPTVNKGHGLNLVMKRISVMNEKPGNNISMDIDRGANGGSTTTFTFNNWL